MKRVAAGAHLPKHWLIERAVPPDDRADYCLGGVKLWVVGKKQLNHLNHMISTGTWEQVVLFQV